MIPSKFRSSFTFKFLNKSNKYNEFLMLVFLNSIDCPEDKYFEKVFLDPSTATFANGLQISFSKLKFIILYLLPAKDKIFLK